MLYVLVVAMVLGLIVGVGLIGVVSSRKDL
jgi:hypothetical protein